jgi:hypothetical protein
MTIVAKARRVVGGVAGWYYHLVSNLPDETALVCNNFSVSRQLSRKRIFVK